MIKPDRLPPRHSSIVLVQPLCLHFQRHPDPRWQFRCALGPFFQLAQVDRHRHYPRPTHQRRNRKRKRANGRAPKPQTVWTGPLPKITGISAWTMPLGNCKAKTPTKESWAFSGTRKDRANRIRWFFSLKRFTEKSRATGPLQPNSSVECHLPELTLKIGREKFFLGQGRFR